MGVAVTVARQVIPEHVVPGKRLGRHLLHDPRSRAYPARMRPLRSVLHRRSVPIYDQDAAIRFRGVTYADGLGDCTGMALAGALSTRPNGHHLREYTAVRLYAEATQLDDVPEAFPPVDTGSSGLAVCAAALDRGLIRRYEHAFSLEQALAALVARPLIVGMSWRTSQDDPDSSGLVHYIGDVRGGHEVCAVGLDVDARTVRFANSWGTGYGDQGYFTMTWDDFGAALGDDGDVTVPLA